MPDEGALECGTSRAEIEHYDDNNNNNNNIEDHVGVGIQPRDFSTLAALREQLATSVVVDPNNNDDNNNNKNNNTPNWTGLTMITSPFQSKVPLVYCDQTASNRPVHSIERYMEQVCLPLYGNTHTNTSITGSQT